MKTTTTVTPVESLPLVGEVELIYRSKIKVSNRPQVTNSAEVARILRATFNEDTIEHHEEFKILLLNRTNRVMGAFTVSVGGQAGTIADPKIIFQAAIKANAAGIVLSHNHPSGNLKPSNADIALTNKIVAGGQLLDIAIVDHVILTAESYYSFADEGIM